MAEPRADEKDSSKLWQDAFSNIDEDMVYLESKSMSVLEPLPREELGLDPVTYEIGKHRIYEILEAGRYALQRVSASPVVTEAGESMFALYTAEGHTALSASGILLHVGPSEVAIKVMLDWYSENPGIHPGDQFFVNDPFIAAHHAADMLIAKPIFYDGELIAWMGSLTHTPSVGSICPGGTCVESTEIFHDGFRFPGIKIVRDHVIDNTILRFLLRASRDTRTLILDTRAKIAGNNTAEKLFLEMVDELGVETVKKIMKQIIYESEDRARKRLRDIPDGRWRAMRLMDNIGRKVCLNKMVLEVTKHGDSLKLDFTGTSPQFDGSQNCTLNNTIGMLFSDLANFLFWDSDWNKGIWHPIELVIPKGCFIRAQFPASSATCPPTTGLVLNSIFAEIIGKMYKAAGMEYEEDINASWSAAHPNPGGGGTDQFGFPFAGVLLDSAASGTGAGAIRDGCDTGGISLFAETNSSDVEMYESKYPLIYLARREWPSSGGHGMFRGGLGGEQIVMVRKGMLRFNQLTMGEFTNITPGLFGGYPTPCNDAMIIYNPELKLDRGEVLDTWEKVKNHPKAEVIERKATTLMDGDIYANRWMGGGGYGDPLDRDPDMVRDDFMEFKINPNDVEEKYGVVIDQESIRVNWEATEKLRERIKEHRMKGWTWPKK